MIARIREQRKHKPFAPFRIITTSRDRYDVFDPRSVAIAETYLLYCSPRSDRSAHIRLNQIVATELLQPNGKRKKLR